jgi:hypothetical protein
MPEDAAAAEKKRKRLEAWKKRREQQNPAPAPPPPAPVPVPIPVPVPVPVVKVSISLSAAKQPLAVRKTRPAAAVLLNKKKKPLNPFGDDDDDEDADDEDDDSDEEGESRKRNRLTVGLGFMLHGNDEEKEVDPQEPPNNKRRRKGRWDAGPVVAAAEPDEPQPSPFNNNMGVGDALDKFMEKLEAGALGSVATQLNETTAEMLSIDVGGSMMRLPKLKRSTPETETAPVVSGGVITSEQLAKLTLASSHNHNHKTKTSSADKKVDPDALYTNSDWESDAQTTGGATSENETDDEEEEKARRAFIEALKSVPGPAEQEEQLQLELANNRKVETLAQVRTEKSRREQKMRDLERDAEEARKTAELAGAPELGRLYNDVEGGVMEEAERNLDAAMAAPDALQVLAELNKKKELKAVNHSQVDYIPFKKNLYIVPRNLANLSSDEVANLRGKLKVKVRGQGAPIPVTSFEQCGLSERILKVMEKQNITTPFPVQAQCLPCIMAGRDVIGIAKTGSGKTLAYLLPMLRHILDQPPLGPNESGPIGLILAPARELAYQIHSVCKVFTKQLGLK